MQLKDLEYFYQLSVYRSYTSVANLLGVSQPTVSYAIKRLEEELECDLVVKDSAHRAVLLTPAGQVLVGHSQKIRQEIEQAKRDVFRVSHHMLHFGIPPIVGGALMPKITRELDKQELTLHIHAIRAGSNALLQMLEKEQLDIALIASLEPLWLEGYQVKEILTKDFYFAMHKHHPLAASKNLTLADVAQENFILLDEHNIHLTAFHRLCYQDKTEPKVLFKIDDIHIVKKMLENQLGISFLTDLALDSQDLGDLVLVPIRANQAPKFHISYAYAEPAPQRAIFEQLLDILEKME